MAMKIERVDDRFRVPAGKKKVSLKDYDPAWMGDKELRRLGKEELKERSAAFLAANAAALSEAQELLYASDIYSVLVIFQAMDAAGKDGTIKHVMSGVNPQGCQVFSFKQPSAEELDHNYLWRYMKSLPERGRIGIFNRSYYEEVLVVRVHPEILGKQKLPPGKHNQKFWEARCDDINNFEQHMWRNGTLIVKFFLHISKAEQKRRFLARLENPEKHWKFSTADMQERRYWNEYEKAFEEMLRATSTPWAPWYVVPADHKFVCRAIVGALLTWKIKSLDLSFPEVGPAKLKELAAAKRALLAEKG